MRSIKIPWGETRAFAEDLHERSTRVLVNGSIGLQLRVGPHPGWGSHRDLDFLAEPTAETFDQVIDAARRAGERLRYDLDDVRKQFIAGTGGLRFDQVLRVDILPADGMADFVRLWNESEEVGLAESVSGRAHVLSNPALEDRYRRKLEDEADPVKRERLLLAIQALRLARLAPE